MKYLPEVQQTIDRLQVQEQEEKHRNRELQSSNEVLTAERAEMKGEHEKLMSTKTDLEAELSILYSWGREEKALIEKLALEEQLAQAEDEAKR